MNDHELAARLATRAGDLLLDVRADFADATAAERKAAGDKQSHDFLMAELAALRPGDSVLSEEATADQRADPARLSADRVWIVDPLDGTREFSELGRDDWAVHVALWSAGELVAGAVALPAQNTTLSTPETAAPRPFDGARKQIDHQQIDQGADEQRGARIETTQERGVQNATCEQGAGQRDPGGVARQLSGGERIDRGRGAERSHQLAPENSLYRLTISRAMLLTTRVITNSVRPPAISWLVLRP